MTATYWEVGRQIVDGEQKGENRAEYGSRLLDRLAEDLTARFGRGFGSINLRLMRRFYLAWPERAIRQTPSFEFVSPCSHRGCDAASEIAQTVSASPSAGLGRVAVSHNVSSAGGACRILQTPSDKIGGCLPRFRSLGLITSSCSPWKRPRHAPSTKPSPAWRLVSTTTGPADFQQILRADASFPQ